MLRDVHADAFDAAFHPVEHGPIWDLAEDKYFLALVGAMLAAGKPVAAVCHAPAALRHVKTPDGKSIAQRKSVACLTNTEVEVDGLSAHRDRA